MNVINDGFHNQRQSIPIGIHVLYFRLHISDPLSCRPAAVIFRVNRTPAFTYIMHVAMCYIAPAVSQESDRLKIQMEAGEK